MIKMASSPPVLAHRTSKLIRSFSHQELLLLDTKAIETSFYTHNEVEVGYRWEDEEDELDSFGHEGVNILAKIITSAPSLKELDITGDMTQNDHAVETFATAVNHHPSLRYVYLRQCGLGSNIYSLSAIISTISFSNLSNLNLSNNGIGSQGVGLISLHIARNPALKSLTLESNCITDDDTFLVAESLKTNTNLEDLYLMCNPITLAGTEKLVLGANFDEHSLNALHDCNHTCTIRTDHYVPDLGLGIESSSLVQKFMDLNFNYPYGSRRERLEKAEIVRKTKIILAIRGNPDHLQGVPMKLLPQVFTFVQKDTCGGNFVLNGHDNLFELLRSSIPL